MAHQQRAVPVPLTGLDESIPVIGTVIDYDYARPIDTLMEKTSVRLLLNYSVLVLNCFFFLQGTLPFMPLAALDKANCGKYIHSPAHDLESLLQTALGIVTFTNGPLENFVRRPIMFPWHDGTMKLIENSFSRTKALI
jgi:hypothetical protein